MDIDTVCVLGGSGFLGQAIAKSLADRGTKVRIVTRGRERKKYNLIILPTVEVFEANIHNYNELLECLRGCQAVINCVGILHETRQNDFYKIHEQIPEKIVNACSHLDIDRIIHISALGASSSAPSRYLQSKASGEEKISNGRNYGIGVSILRPSVVFGIGDKFLNLFAKIINLFPIIPLQKSNAKFQPIYVEDLAFATVSSLFSKKMIGETIDLVGPKVYTLGQLFQYLNELLSKKRIIFPLNDKLAYAQAYIMEFLPFKIITRDNLKSMQVESTSKTSFEKLFGKIPRSLESVAPRIFAKQVLRNRTLNKMRKTASR